MKEIHLNRNKSRRYIYVETDWKRPVKLRQNFVDVGLPDDKFFFFSFVLFLFFEFR